MPGAGPERRLAEARTVNWVRSADLGKKLGNGGQIPAGPGRCMPSSRESFHLHEFGEAELLQDLPEFSG
jgi:hypothetical protein